MADETLRADPSGGKRSYAMIGDDPRVVHLEGRVERVEGDVRDIKAGVQKLLERPTNPGFSQVITTLVSTLAFCSFIFGFAEWRLGQAVAPVRAEVEKVQAEALKRSDSQHAADIRMAIMEDRLSTLREKAKTP